MADDPAHPGSAQRTGTGAAVGAGAAGVGAAGAASGAEDAEQPHGERREAPADAQVDSAGAHEPVERRSDSAPVEGARQDAAPADSTVDSSLEHPTDTERPVNPEHSSGTAGRQDSTEVRPGGTADTAPYGAAGAAGAAGTAGAVGAAGASRPADAEGVQRSTDDAVGAAAEQPVADQGREQAGGEPMEVQDWSVDRNATEPSPAVGTEQPGAAPGVRTEPESAPVTDRERGGEAWTTAEHTTRDRGAEDLTDGRTAGEWGVAEQGHVAREHQGRAVQDHSFRDQPVEDGSAQDRPVQDGPAQDGSVEDHLAQDRPVDGGDVAPEDDPFFRQEQMLRDENGELPPKAPEFGTPEDGGEQQR